MEQINYNVDKINQELKGWDGGKYFGQWETDKVIESYFPQQDSGVCVEVGAADGVRGSNTLYFEKLGWKTLCIEPNPKQFNSLENHRKNIAQCAISDKAGRMKLTVFDVGEKNIMSSLTSLSPDKRLVKDHSHIINDSYDIEVDVFTLPRVLQENKVSNKIDFISIDTEGTEINVLRGMDFEKYTVSLYVIENNYADESIKEIMQDNGYVQDQRYKINEFYINKTK